MLKERPDMVKVRNHRDEPKSAAKDMFQMLSATTLSSLKEKVNSFRIQTVPDCLDFVWKCPHQIRNIRKVGFTMTAHKSSQFPSKQGEDIQNID